MAKMLRKKLITLFILTSLSGTAIANHLHSPKEKDTYARRNSSELVLPRTNYTGVVATVDSVAEQITVRITAASSHGSHAPRSYAPSFGSGVVLARQGNTYYVATAKHLLNKDEPYTIALSDGETYQIDSRDIIRSDAYDLAILKFSSEKNHTVATVSNSTIENYVAMHGETPAVFVSGFAHSAENADPERIITGGTALPNNDFITGLLYRNISYPGMEGGAVLNRSGHLIGINIGTETQLFEGDKAYEDTSIGLSKGIPIYERIVGFFASSPQLDSQWLNFAEHSTTEVSNDDWNNIVDQLLTVALPADDADAVAWLNYGNQLWRYGKHYMAVEALERAISIDPNLDQAYYTLGLVYWDQDNDQLAARNLKAAIQIEQNTSYWYLLSAAYRAIAASGTEIELHEKAEIAALDKAIAMAPQNFVLHMELAISLRKQQRLSEAISVHNEAIRLRPSHPSAYNDRAITYTLLNEHESAISDYTRAIAANPLFAKAYNNRGITYSHLNQYENAIADYDQAISIAPHYALAYRNRGDAYASIGNYVQALSDYDQLAALNPNNGDIDSSRRWLRAMLQQQRKVAVE